MDARWNASQATAGLMLALTLTLGPAEIARAGGLRCSIGEVVIDNLKIGHSYSLQALANLPLVITNTADQAATIRVQPLVPDAGELRPGVDAIPAVAWASARPDSFVLAPHESKSVEMMLTIPDDERLFGRKFLVNFWSHTMAQAGDLLAYGLKSRVIFSIDQARDTSAVAPMGELSVTLTPSELRLEGLARGREYPLAKGKAQPLVVQNNSSRPLSLELQVLSPEHSAARLPEGFGDLMGSGEVTLSPSKFTLQPGEKRTISGTVLFPKGKALQGKNFMCVLCAAIVDLPVKTQIYSRLFAQLK
jgi:hypothetical protein